MHRALWDRLGCCDPASRSSWPMWAPNASRKHCPGPAPSVHTNKEARLVSRMRVKRECSSVQIEPETKGGSSPSHSALLLLGARKGREKKALSDHIQKHIKDIQKRIFLSVCHPAFFPYEENIILEAEQTSQTNAETRKSEISFPR